MTSAHRYRATWRDVLFNGVYDDSGLVDERSHVGGRAGRGAYENSDFRLESLDLSRVSTEDFREMRQFLEGADPNEAYEGVMIATGRGSIMASSPADLSDRTRLLRSQFGIANCRIAAIGLDPEGVLPFDFKDDTAGGSLALRVYARPATGRPVVIGRMREGLIRPFLFQLACFDPRVYAQAEQTVALSIGGGALLTNAGNTYTLPRFTIVTSGAATFSLAIGGSSANTVSFASLPAGTWTFDCRRSIITRASDGASGMPYRTAGYLSSLFLLPGANSVALTGTGLSSASAVFRSAWS